MSVINRKSTDTLHIEFVSYDGEYPNLCRGVLTVKINGEIVKFGHHYMNHHWHEDIQKWVFEDEDPDNPNYNSFWASGGSIHDRTGNYDFEVEHSEWEIDVDELPEQLWDYADELDRIINENIPYGCCGGCT